MKKLLILAVMLFLIGCGAEEELCFRCVTKYTSGDVSKRRPSEIEIYCDTYSQKEIREMEKVKTHWIGSKGAVNSVKVTETCRRY